MRAACYDVRMDTTEQHQQRAPSLQELQAKKAKLQQQLQEIQRAERRAKMRKKRADDARRKIIAGAYFLRLAETDSTARGLYNAMLENFAGNMKRQDDRALFGLPPLPQPEKTDWSDLAKLGSLD